jgi:peptidoglycan/LPS O-acetylase OafA/YrhL
MEQSDLEASVVKPRVDWSDAWIVERVESLDGLRALAVLLVFAAHWDPLVVRGSQSGVDVFFVLSGYLITSLLLRERDRSGTVNVRRFYTRRMLRLYPALFVLVLVVTPIAVYHRLGQPPFDSLAALTYLTNFWVNHPGIGGGAGGLTAHTWSLGVEEQFYLIWPPVIVYAAARGWRLGRVVVAGVVGGIVLTLIMPHISGLAQPSELPTTRVVELGAGALLTIATQQRVPAMLRSLCGTIPAVAALVLLLVAEFLPPYDWWSDTVWALLCFPIVGHLVLHRGSRISRAFSLRPAVWLGERSYGFYLCHYPVIVLLARSSPASRGTFVTGLALSLAICALSYRYIEQPFLRIKNERYTPPKLSSAAAPSAPG